MYAEVVVDVAASELDRVFDYEIPRELEKQIKIGSLVRVEFGGKFLAGFVLAVKQHTQIDRSKIKKIRSCENKDVLAEQLKLADYMCKQFFLRKIDVLRLFLPPESRKENTPKRQEKFIVEVDHEKLSNLESTLRKNAIKLLALIDFLVLNELPFNVTELNDKFGAANIKKLESLGYIKTKIFKKTASPKVLDLNEKKISKLNTEQQAACDEINNSINNKNFLLFGVTGSGKTEVYLNVIEKVLGSGKTAIMLVPEISLTPQIFARFKNRFGQQVAIIHSGLTNPERESEWLRIKNGEAKVVVGARSAIFSPVKNLGIIVLDEEHDGSYISDSSPRYNTIKVAEFLAEANNAKLVLGSATPSIESFLLATNSYYKLIELKERVKNLPMPKIEIVDMIREIREGNPGIFSTRLIAELKKTVGEKKQALIFINRRGFSSFIRCAMCGYIPKCTDCDVSLVFHKDDKQLKCHYCGKRFKELELCPKCDGVIRYGAVGSQQVAQELKKMFPEVLVLRLDNDAVTTKDSYLEILEKFNNTKPAILVGTQMIAKGHDFADVNLIGAVDADLSLHFADFRAFERTYSLITQVAGRAGRADKQGLCILQTYSPKHFVYRNAIENNYVGFFKKELKLREATHFPPYATICRILVCGEKEDISKHACLKLFEKVKHVRKQYEDDFWFCDIQKSPIKRIKNKFRYQILMRFKCEKSHQILDEVHQIILTEKLKGVTIFVEVNPQNLS